MGVNAVRADQAGAWKESPFRRRILRAGLVVAGIVLTQAVLIGPSLLGTKILLPLDLLPVSGINPDPEHPPALPHNHVFSDLVMCFGLFEFTADELRAGRLPLWNPYIYAGAPLATVPKYSPFYLLYWVCPFPVMMAYIVLCKALVAGVGAYLFFRRTLHIGYWPAAVGAWCFPLTGFFVLWQGYPMTATVAWLPWLLLATDRVARRPGGWGGLALAAGTLLVLISGQLDVAGQVLLVAGIYFLWRLASNHGRQIVAARAGGAILAATAGWGLGFLLAAPFLLPLLEYSRTGDRLLRRRTGTEERPPVGLSVLPQTVVPNFYGSTERGDWYLGAGGNQLESASSAYAGLLATLLAAPLAWCSPRRRREAWFWLGLGIFTLSWQLHLPGLVSLLRLPGLNMLSHNRFAFATAFALLTLAVMGLDAVMAGEPTWSRWFALPVGLLLLLGATCIVYATEPFGIFVQRFESLVPPKRFIPFGSNREEVLPTIYAHSKSTFLWATAFCLVALTGWLAIWTRRTQPSFVPLLLPALVVELLAFGYNVNPQCDPALFFPRVPALAQLAEKPPGRILGVRCLPPDLNMMYGLRDVRGYDAVDPRRLLEVLELARQPEFDSPIYAQTQYYVPRLDLSPSGELKVPPVLSMLNVRYLLFLGKSPAAARPLLQDQPYWVMENHAVLPRAFVPGHVRTVAEAKETLARLAAADFDPRRVAYVEGPVDLPPECAGSAQITAEVPSELVVAADMTTPGLLVLADQWYEGWRAYRDDQVLPILRVNHMLRGVILPAGRSTVVFRYEPESFALGLRLLLLALVALVAWATTKAVLQWRAAHGTSPAGSAAAPTGPATGPPLARSPDDEPAR